MTLPLISGTLDSRFAVRFDDHSAYYTNPLNSAFDPGDLKHDWEARGSLKWTPSGVPLTVLWTYDYLGGGRYRHADGADRPFNTGLDIIGGALGPFLR